MKKIVELLSILVLFTITGAIIWTRDLANEYGLIINGYSFFTILSVAAGTVYFTIKKVPFLKNSHFKNGIFHADARIFLTAYGLSILYVFLCIYYLILFANGNLCRSNLLSEAISPNGKEKLVVFNYDCGATSGFSTHASIINKNDNLPNSPGELLIIDGDNGAVSSVFKYEKGGPKIKTSWENPSNLVISYPQKTRFFKKQEIFEDITIKYKEY